MLMLVVTFAGALHAKAQVTYGLQIAGVEVTSENCNDLSVIPGVSGKVKFNPDTKTLTLENASINYTDVENFGTNKQWHTPIYNRKIENLIIEIKGEYNSITTESEGIDIDRKTTINGGGTINIEAGDESCSISAIADLTIANCALFTNQSISGMSGQSITIRNAKIESGGIYRFGSLTLDDCKITNPTNAVYDTTLRAISVNGKEVQHVEIEPVYDLQIAGANVTYENCDDLSVISGVNGTVKYNPYTKTLTLENASIDVFDVGIRNTSVKDLKIMVKGTNYVSTIKGIDDGFDAVGLRKSTTITGGGVLNLEAGMGSGIGLSYNASLLIENCTVNAKGTWGISGPGNVESEILTIRNANVTAEGYRGSISEIRSLILEGCQILSPDGAAFDRDLTGVALDGEIVTSKIVIGETALYDVVLIDYGPSKINAIKITREVTGLGLKESKDLVESAPCVVLENLKKSEAQAICDKFTEIGATAYIYIHGTWDPTGIETVEANTAYKGKRGIYSIGGIYLGNDMDALPKGIYIKDGKKVVK